MINFPEINEKKIKTWSLIGSRATFGMVMLELPKIISDLMVMTADVSTSAGLDRYRKTFPENYLDVGIAEQNLIGIATGMASQGHCVFTTTFAPFQTMRCCEQIKVNLGYMREKVIMVGLASGIVLGNLGYTHCCIEDMSVMRSIPNITVLSPSDTTETVKAIYASIEHKNSVYIRLTGGSNNPIVNKSDYSFEIGKAITLKNGKDITIFSTGTMVYESLKASEILEQSGMSCSVINMHTIKPIDKDIIRQHAKNSKLFVTVEEHNKVGGLGSSVAEFSSTLTSKPKQLFIGINDQYDKGGDYTFLKDKNGLNAVSIANQIKINY